MWNFLKYNKLATVYLFNKPITQYFLLPLVVKNREK